MFPGSENWGAGGQAIWENGCNVAARAADAVDSITVVKHLIPSDDPGKFNLEDRRTGRASGVGDGGDRLGHGRRRTHAR